MEIVEQRPSWRMAGWVSLAVIVLSLCAYAPSLTIPFISDDYLQIDLGRQYGAPQGWAALAGDALYRCRATSLVMTYLTERLFGASEVAFSASSLALHILNALLVLALGMWRPLGWRTAAVAACVFAVAQRHHEAVIWYAALPELLVFFFAVLAFLCWVAWLQGARRGPLWYAGACLCYLLALLSKESAVAVVGLMGVAAALEPQRRLRSVLALAPFALGAAAYFGLAYMARGSHQHFNDGTFSLHAPFLTVMAHSAARLLGVWGWLALAALAFWRVKGRVLLLTAAAAWMAISLAPYSFLTYMPRVPSRHTYLASVAMAMVVAAGFLELNSRLRTARRPAILGAIVGVFVLHQSLYLWLAKQPQFEQRAYPTEEVVRLADQGVAQIYIKCFPYAEDVAGRALRIKALHPDRTQVIFGPAAQSRPDALDLCESAQQR
jgi:hypothetical protein